MQEKLYNCVEPEDENTLRLQFFQVLDHCIQYFDEVCSIASVVCNDVFDMTLNTKKPDDLVHKLAYKCNRIWPLVLWPYPEDFEKLAYSETFL